MVAHTKTVHHLALRIVLLREDVIVAIGLEESLHVVILCLVSHEEHVLVAILLQHRGDTLAAWSYRSLHQVAEHEGRETVERSRHAMVGMDAGTIEVGERQGMLIERIERWSERLLIAECAQQVCRHRLHQYHHHVRMILLRRRLTHLHHQGIVHHLTLQNIRAIHLSRNTQPLAVFVMASAYGMRCNSLFSLRISSSAEVRRLKAGLMPSWLRKESSQ